MKEELKSWKKEKTCNLFLKRFNSIKNMKKDSELFKKCTCCKQATIRKIWCWNKWKIMIKNKVETDILSQSRTISSENKIRKLNRSLAVGLFSNLKTKSFLWKIAFRNLKCWMNILAVLVHMCKFIHIWEIIKPETTASALDTSKKTF